MMNKYNWLFFTCVLLFCFVSTLGCQKKSKLDGLVSASGVVMFENAPVEGARVTFAPVSTSSGEKRVATATTDSKGRFSMMTLNPGDGVFPGQYAVAITKLEQLGQVVTETSADGEVQRRRTDERIRELLPTKYKEAKTSGLTVTISEKGDKYIEFKLEGKVDDTPKMPSGPGARRR